MPLSARFVPNVQSDPSKTMTVTIEGRAPDGPLEIRVLELDNFKLRVGDKTVQKRENAGKDDLLATFQGSWQKNRFALKTHKNRYKPTAGQPCTTLRLAVAGAAATLVPVCEKPGEKEGRYFELGIELLHKGKRCFRTEWPALYDRGLRFQVLDALSQKPIASRPALLRCADGSLKPVQLDAAGRATLRGIPEGACELLTSVAEPLPGAFETLPAGQLSYARILGLRTATIGAGDEKVRAAPKDDTLLPLLAKLDATAHRQVSQLEGGFTLVPGAGQGDASLARLFRAACLLQALETAGKAKTAFDSDFAHRVETALPKLASLEQDERVGLALGVLLSKTGSPDLQELASRHLLWALARRVQAARSALEGGEPPAALACFALALARAAEPLAKAATGDDPKIAQALLSHAVGLGHDVLATTAAPLFAGKDARKQRARTALERCYARLSEDWKLPEGDFAWTLQRKPDALDWDWQAPTRTWAAPPALERKLVARDFLRKLHSGPVRIPLGCKAAGGALKLVDFAAGEGVNSLTAGFKHSAWEQQSYYLRRVVRAGVNLFGIEPMRGPVGEATKRRDALYATFLKKGTDAAPAQGVGHLLELYKTRTRKYFLDIARRQALLVQGSFGATASGHQKIATGIRRDIKLGQKQIATELALVEQGLAAYLAFLSTPQVQGVIAGLPAKEHKSWRTKALRASAPLYLLGETRLGYRFLRSVFQPEVFAGSVRPSPLWVRDLDVGQRSPRYAGLDLEAWCELYPALKFHGLSSYELDCKKTLACALGVEVAQLERTAAGKQNTKRIETGKPAAEAQETLIDLMVNLGAATERKDAPLIAKYRQKVKAALKKLTGVSIRHGDTKQPRSSSDYPYQDMGKASYVDWIARNSELPPTEIHYEQLNEVVLLFNLGLGKRLSIHSLQQGTNLSKAVEVEMLVTIASTTGDYVGYAETGAKLVGRGADYLINAGKLARFSSFLSSASRAIVAWADKAGKVLGPLGLFLGLLSFGDAYLEGDHLSMAMSAVGLAAGIVGLAVAGSTNPIGWVLLACAAIGIVSSAIASYFGFTAAYKAAKKMGYDGEGRCPLIIHGFEFRQTARGRFVLWIYWPKKEGKLSVKFWESDDYVLDQSINLQGTTSNLVKDLPLRSYTCRVPDAVLEKLQPSMWELSQAPNEAGVIDFYLQVSESADFSRPKNLLPPLSVGIEERTGKVLDVAPQKALLVRKIDLVKKMPIARKFADVDYMFWIQCGRGGVDHWLRCVEDDYVGDDVLHIGGKDQVKKRSKRTAFSGSGFGFFDREIRTPLKNQFPSEKVAKKLAVPGKGEVEVAELHVYVEVAVERHKQLPVVDLSGQQRRGYTNTNNQNWKLSIDKQGRILNATCDKVRDFALEQRGKGPWEMKLKWDQRDADLYVRFWDNDYTSKVRWLDKQIRVIPQRKKWADIEGDSFLPCGSGHMLMHNRNAKTYEIWTFAPTEEDPLPRQTSKGSWPGFGKTDVVLPVGSGHALHIARKTGVWALYRLDVNNAKDALIDPHLKDGTLGAITPDMQFTAVGDQWLLAIGGGKCHLYRVDPSKDQPVAHKRTLSWGKKGDEFGSFIPIGREYLMQWFAASGEYALYQFDPNDENVLTKKTQTRVEKRRKKHGFVGIPGGRHWRGGWLLELTPKGGYRLYKYAPGSYLFESPVVLDKKPMKVKLRNFSHTFPAPVSDVLSQADLQNADFTNSLDLYIEVANNEKMTGSWVSAPWYVRLEQDKKSKRYQVKYAHK